MVCYLRHTLPSPCGLYIQLGTPLLQPPAIFLRDCSSNWRVCATALLISTIFLRGTLVFLTAPIQSGLPSKWRIRVCSFPVPFKTNGSNLSFCQNEMILLSPGKKIQFSSQISKALSVKIFHFEVFNFFSSRLSNLKQRGP